MRPFQGTNAEWRKSITWIIVVVLVALPFAGGPVWFSSVLVALAYLLEAYGKDWRDAGGDQG